METPHPDIDTADPSSTSIPTVEAGRKQLRNLFVTCLIITVALVCLYLFPPRIVQLLGLRITDTIQSLTVFPDSGLEAAIVVIDDRSLEKYGQWPWPRYLIAQLLRKISQGGAEAVSLSILFPERDRSSPTTWLEGATERFGFQLDITNGLLDVIDFDSYLAQALSQGPHVLAYSFLFNTPAREKKLCNPEPVIPHNHEILPSLFSGLAIPEATDIVCNHPPLAEAVQYSGFLNASSDADGIIRRMPLLIEYHGSLYPSFALAAIMQLQSNSAVQLQTSAGLRFSTMSVGRYKFPVSRRGDFLINPYRQKTKPHISAADVLGENLPENALNKEIILVGLSASGLSQDVTTPFARRISALEMHRIAIKTITSGFSTVRVHLFPLLEAGFTVFLCLLLVIIIHKSKTLRSGLLVVAIIALSWLLVLFSYAKTGYLFSPLLPTTALLLNYFVLSLLKTNFSWKLAHSEKGSALDLLQTTEDNLQSILKAVPDIIFRLDSNGRIIFVSPAVSRYLEPQSLLGLSIFDLVPPEEVERSRFRLNERRTGDRATRDFEVVFQLTKKGGNEQEKVRYFSVSAEGIYSDTVNQKGKYFHGTQGIARDITERKKLENQLLQAQKMEVVGNLAAGVAHDLNNILSGLVSYPDLLLLEIPENDPLHKKITLIQNSGKKAAVIVQDLLTLARRNRDISELCDLNTIITDYLNSAEFHQLQSQHPSVHIISKLSPGLLHVKGSAIHLSKVMMNLIYNGAEAMPAGGELEVSTENVCLTEAQYLYEEIPQGEYVCVTIVDSGIGIAREDLPRIFEPFYTKKLMRSSGTGIGMTVIWATIKDHDGYIDIQSEEGYGTSIAFYLPSTKEKQLVHKSRFMLEEYVGTESILLVDDVSEQRRIGQGMLQKLGYRVQTVASGEEALQRIKTEKFDLLILDMIMPGGMDGLETYQAASELHPGQKSIITSGFSESQRVAELLKLGAGAYIQKPFTLEEIGVAVRKELDRK